MAKKNKKNKTKKQPSPRQALTTSTTLSTAVVDSPPFQESSQKKNVSHKEPKVPFETKMWLIFGVGVSIFAIIAASIFDLSFGATLEDLIDKRFSDLLLAILAISSSIINIIFDIKAEIDANSKINYAIFPVITAVFSLAYYSFLYGKSDELDFLQWNWVLPITLVVLGINVFIGFTLTSKVSCSEKSV